MYETYFNLNDRPFASVPRADHYHPAAAIDAARKTLTRCIDRGEGVGLVVGPSGSGKSLLCHVLAAHFQPRFQVALLASTHLDTRRTLLQAILYELNRPYRGMDEGELRLALVDYIAINDDCAGGTLLLVDEAHHLSLRLLDELRALTNVARAMQPAVRLVLAGNHVLEERFASPRLESFSQRISARCYLEAFQRDETQAYIWARLAASGGRSGEIFPAETCRMVHKATGGVPRLINQVCDHVMLLAYAAEIDRIEPAHVEEAWADLQQLPTPWNAPATSPAGDSVIEFGGLDDDLPLEAPPIAGKIGTPELEEEEPAVVAIPPASRAASAVANAPMDFETSRQLRQVRKLMADIDAEFFPNIARAPEVELIFESPFEEPFEEEEVIAERYPAAALAPPVSPAAFTPPAAQPAAQQAAMVATSQAAKSQAESPAAVTDVVVNRLDASHAAPATGTAVPPPRKDLGRLFAKLRRGL